MKNWMSGIGDKKNNSFYDLKTKGDGKNIQSVNCRIFKDRVE